MNPSGQHRPRTKTWKKIRIKDTRTHRIYIAVPGGHPCMVRNFRIFCKPNSRKRDELGVRLLSTFNIQWEGTVSGNRGLDLLISGTYIPKINLKIFSQNSGIWEADTSIMQRDSTTKIGKSPWYLGGENPPPPTFWAHFEYCVHYGQGDKKTAFLQSHVWKHGSLWGG